MNETQEKRITGLADPKVEITLPRLEALLFFDSANETKEGKQNLIGIFDRMIIPKGAKHTPQFGLFLRTGQTIDQPVEVVIFAPSGRPIARGRMNAADSGEENYKRLVEAQQAGQPPRLQLLVELFFPVPEEGLYWFSVEYDGRVLGGAALQVTFREVEEDASHT